MTLVTPVSTTEAATSQDSGEPGWPGLAPSLHGLRHTWATLALRAGVHVKVVSERMGHANISITLNTYTSVIPAMESAAGERVAALFQPESVDVSVTHG
ncbi:MAG TPA: tyrosine-type recombinase/integrase [Dehalococcoidia bacterium]|nr:tyrosine-type recombinase/integrase [Dehalococcoidia bacterium]